LIPITIDLVSSSDPAGLGPRRSVLNAKFESLLDNLESNDLITI